MKPPRPHDSTLAAKPVRRKSFRVELLGFPVNIMVYRKQKSRDHLRGWVIKASFRVPCSRTGKPNWFCAPVEVDFTGSGSVTREKIAKHVMAALIYSFEHEVQELLTIDGRRAFPDPHVKKRGS